jgi:hypothetical protein
LLIEFNSVWGFLLISESKMNFRLLPSHSLIAMIFCLKISIRLHLPYPLHQQSMRRGNSPIFEIRLQNHIVTCFAAGSVSGVLALHAHRVSRPPNPGTNNLPIEGNVP